MSAFVSITEVKTSSDLRYARVFVSILGSQEERQEALTGLRSATKFLRHELAGRLNLRQIPELSFHRDDSIERGARILSILQELAPAPTDGPTET